MEGRVLASRYRLVSKLGQGGMGTVWRAEHLELGTSLAIKLMDESYASCPTANARFKLEAQAAAELRSAHVVQIFDFGIDEQVPYIAMELLNGETLEARLTSEGALSPAATATILTQVARALSRAHSVGIIHRDLKPANIFLALEDNVAIAKVLDFGIVKRLGLDGDNRQGALTTSGTIIGSPNYMSPEQVLGSPGLDQRTDIWSLGVIAFECLTGKCPFERETVGATMMAICSEPIPIPSGISPVPDGFDEWFVRMVARDREERFKTVSDAVECLVSVCSPDRPLIATKQTIRLERSEPSPPPDPDSQESLLYESFTFPGLTQPNFKQRTRWLIAVGVGLVGVTGALLGWQLIARKAPSELGTSSSLRPPDTGVRHEGTISEPPSIAVLPTHTSVSDASPTASVRDPLEPPRQPNTAAPVKARLNKSVTVATAPTTSAMTLTIQNTSTNVAPSTSVPPSYKPRSRRNYDKAVGF